MRVRQEVTAINPAEKNRHRPRTGQWKIYTETYDKLLPRTRRKADGFCAFRRQQ